MNTYVIVHVLITYTMHAKEWKKFIAVHSAKEKANGMLVMTIPIILFCYDTSGNKSKKWNKFIEWDLIIAGTQYYTYLRNCLCVACV